MTVFQLRLVCVALLALVVTSACNGKGTLGPDPLPPPTGGGCPPEQVGTPPNCAPGNPLDGPAVNVSSPRLTTAVTGGVKNGNTIVGTSSTEFYYRIDYPATVMTLEVRVNGQVWATHTTGGKVGVATNNRKLGYLIPEMEAGHQYEFRVEVRQNGTPVAAEDLMVDAR
jgi:hypothetical protein